MCSRVVGIRKDIKWIDLFIDFYIFRGFLCVIKFAFVIFVIFCVCNNLNLKIIWFKRDYEKKVKIRLSLKIIGCMVCKLFYIKV